MTPCRTSHLNKLFAYLLSGIIILTQVLPGNARGPEYQTQPLPDTASISFVYDQDGNLASLMDAHGKITNLTYDSNHNLTSITDGVANRVTKFSYDPSGNVSSITDANGNTRQFEFNNDNSTRSITDASGNTTTLHLDDAARLSRLVNAAGNSVEFEYDPNNNVISVKTNNGITRFEYDANNHLVKSTDANDHAIRYAYDSKGNLVEVVDGAGQKSSYVYGNNNTLVQSIDPAKHITQFGFDRSGRLLEEIDPLGNRQIYQYDPNGNLLNKTDAEGRKIQFTYDTLNRLIRRSTSSGSDISYNYDVSGNLIGVSAPNGEIGFQYDQFNQLSSTVDSKGKTITYAYDLAGNLVSIIYPTSNDWLSKVKAFFGVREKITYEFDPDNRLTTIKSAGSTKLAYDLVYDVAGRLSAVGPNSVSTSKSYGVVGQYKYDDNSRLTSLTWSNPVTTIQTLSYLSDPVGNVQSFTDNIGTTEYEYDEANRLTSVMSSDGTSETFVYDAAGNRTQKRNSVKGIIDYTYNEANQLIKSSDGTTYAYDKNGNLKTKNTAGQKTTYTWDDENHLVRIDYADGSNSRYTYDGLGRRISKTDRQGKTVFYSYDGDHIAQVLDEQGKVLTNYVPGFAIDHPYAVTQDGKTYYFLYDRLGSVIGLVDKQGSLVVSYRYDAWGNVVEKTGEVENAIRFTGREWDDESGLYYYRERYYDPMAGRFISRDPLPDLLKSIPNQNKYIYVNNNPTNFTDPFGLQSSGGGGGGADGPVWSPQSDTFYGRVEERIAYKMSQLTMGKTVEYLVDPFLGLVGTAKDIFELTKGVEKGDYETVGRVFTPKALDMITDKAFSITSAKMAITLGTTILTPSLAPYAIPTAIAYGTIVVPGKIIAESIGEELVNSGQKVGGVSLNKSAELLVDINEIKGAYYDETSQQVILIGKNNLALPPMSMDDLVVAIRSVYNGEDPAVTIDPGPTDQEMVVRFFGQTENTEFGRVMFESDRLLKTLSMGRDNVTKNNARPQMPGFKNELEFALEHFDPLQKSNVWHRMWFYPKEMTLNKTKDGKGMIFDQASLEVKSEYLPPYESLGSDPAALAFATQLTINYDELAKEYPDLEKLRQLAKIVSVVKWLKDNQVPIDLSWVGDYQVKNVPTEKTTPTQKVWSEEVQRGLWTYQVGLFGGVDFQFSNKYEADEDQVKPIINAALEAQPQGSISWDFTSKGEDYKAVAITLGQTQQMGNYNFALSIPAGTLPSAQGASLSVVPTYDSFNFDQPSLLGYGWKLLPYDLIFPKPDSVFVDGKRVWFYQIFFNDNLSGTTYEYRLSRDQNGVLVYWSEEADQALVLKRNPDDSYAVTRSDGIEIGFDQNGRLNSLTDRYKNKTVFTYDGDLVKKIKNNNGQSLTFTYNDAGRIIQSQDFIGRTVQYYYDAAGNLSSITDARGNSVSYSYDEDHHLVWSSDAMQQPVFKSSYDDFGRIQDFVDSKNQAYSISYDTENRPTAITDAVGDLVSYEYDDQNRLVKITDPLGSSVSYEYNSSNLPIRVIDRNGVETSLEYDSRGHITKISVPVASWAASPVSSSVQKPLQIPESKVIAPTPEQFPTETASSTTKTSPDKNIPSATLVESGKLMAHKSRVTSIAFTPDGAWMVTGSDDYTARVWRMPLKGNTPNEELSGHEDVILDVAISQNGSFLATGSADNTIKIWGMPEGNFIKTLIGHSGDVEGLAFSPDNSLLASTGQNGEIIIWNTSNWSKYKKITSDSGTIFAVSFSPDGETIASGSEDNLVKSWRVSDGSLLKTFVGHTDIVFDVAFSPSGESIVSCSGEGDGSIKTWMLDGTLLRTFRPSAGGILSTNFDPSGKMIVGVGGIWDSPKVWLWDEQSGKMLSEIDVKGAEAARDVTFIPNENKLAAVFHDGTVRLWTVDYTSSVDTPTVIPTLQPTQEQIGLLEWELKDNATGQLLDKGNTIIRKEDVYTDQGTLQSGDAYYEQSIALSSNFAIGIRMVPQNNKSDIGGFGLVLKRLDMDTFSWEWFVTKENYIADKLQENGQLQYTIGPVKSGWFVTAIWFITDVKLRAYLPDDSSLESPAWILTISKDSYIFWPTP